MFQPNVFFPNYPNDSGTRKLRAEEAITTEKTPNSAKTEGEEDTATCLGRPKGAKSVGLEIIHRVPSVEEDTATCLGNSIVVVESQKINSKNAPNELSLEWSTKTTQGE